MRHRQSWLILIGALSFLGRRGVLHGHRRSWNQGLHAVLHEQRDRQHRQAGEKQTALIENPAHGIRGSP